MVNCVHCGKRFKAQKDLDMHCKAVHRSFDCSVCFKKFKTPQSKNQHFEAVHAESYRPDPPVLSAGEWVHWDEFKGNKSFGYFLCDNCNKKWISAHAYKNYRQGCQNCETYDYPKLLWVNFESSERRWDIEDDAEHDRFRCEACKAGACLRRTFI